ncbi:MAG TPA: undecaprenyl-diphosphatase [Bacillales bacterium]|nr:undecaprenyl-diphosphatase [Bacillales bacterium]
MDQRIFRAINQFSGRYRLLDRIMITISQKLRYLFILIFIVLWFRNHFYKKLTINTGISIVLAMLINIFIRLCTFRRRPFLNHVVHLLPPVPSKRNSSFPSKHTTLVFAAATFAYFYHRMLGIVMYVLSFLAGISRIWMGQHYPSDIAGSALLGSFISLMVKNTERVWNPLYEKIIQRYKRFLEAIGNPLS